MNSSFTPPPRRRTPSLFGTLLTFFILMTVGSALQSIPIYGVLLHLMTPTVRQMTLDFLLGKIDFESAMLFFEQATTDVANHPLFIIATLVGTMALVGVFIFWAVCIQKQPLSSLGIRKKKAVSHYLLGTVLGFLMFGAAIGICKLSGAVEISLSPNIRFAYIGLYFFGFLIQGFEEELLLRGYLLGGIRRSSSAFGAVFLSSVLFSFMHVGNQGIGGLAILNLTLFGVFEGLYYLRTNSIWGVAAIHTMWNFVQGNIFGCYVSGMTRLDSLLSTSLTEGRDLTHGGAFGPEGGIAVTIVLVIGIFLLLWMAIPSLPKEKQE